MTRKGSIRGLKRSKAPKLWKIARKEKKWTINPRPGPHNREAIPLAFILRDYLGYAHTLREAKRILNERKVKINGKVRTDFRFPVGLMDVVEIPQTEEFYRVMPNFKGTPVLYPIAEKEKHFRPLKIVGKYVAKSGKIQLRFHDGTVLLVGNGGKKKKKKTEKVKEVKEGEVVKEVRVKREEKIDYKPFGTLVYDFESHRILEYFPFTEGNFAMVTRGRNVCKTGRIASVKESIVEIEGEELFRTLKENVLIVGTRESIIQLPGD